MNIADLEKIAQLREKGIITEEEFEKEKRKIMSAETVTSLDRNTGVYNKPQRYIASERGITNNTNDNPKYRIAGRKPRQQGEGFVWIIAIIIVIIVLIIISSDSNKYISNNSLYNSYNSSSEYNSYNSSSKYNSYNSSYSSLYQEDFTLESKKMQVDEWGISLHIVGTIKNNRNKKYSYAQVTFNLYDKNGAQLGSAIANINNLEPYGKWKYDAIGLISNPEEVASYKLGEIIGF